MQQSSRSRAASDTNRSNATSRKRSFALAAVIAGIVFLAGGPLNVMAQQAPASLVVAPGHEQQTKVDQAPNGTPVVQIATPNSAGVSHNVYDQYNVGTNGQILNNSHDDVQTQLGGWIQGNAHLAPGQSASLILNEVTSTNPSALNGYIEVAGTKADVIVANPNGITCNGCGFINTSRATLTTGRPVFGGDGSLSAFQVGSGNLQITGLGFDGSNLDRVDLIARAVQLNAAVWAKELNVVAGANTVTANTLATQALTGNGAAPTIGIDVSALGGMYAQKIRLVGTDAGVGVRSAGDLVATGGDFTLSANGDVQLAGRTAAAGAVRVDAAGNAQLTGKNYGTTGLAVTGQTVTVGGDTWTGGALNATSRGDINVSGTTQAQQVALTAQGNVTTAGSVQSAGTTMITSQGALNNGAQWTAGQDLTIQAARVDQSGQLASQQNVQITTGALSNTGTVVGNGNIGVSAQTIDNSGQFYAQKTATVAAGGAIHNSGLIAGHDAVVVRGASLTQDATGELSSSVSNDVAVTGALSNAGKLLSDGTLAVRAGAALNNTGTVNATGVSRIGAGTLNNAGAIAGNATLAINVAGNATNTGSVVAGSGLSMQAGSLSNGGALGSQAGDVTLSTTDDLANNSAITATQGALTTNAGGTLTNAGAFSAAGPVQIGASVLNNGGSVESGTTLAMTVAGNATNTGSAIGGTGLTMQAGSLSSSGTLGSQTGDVALTTTGDLSVTGTVAATQGALTANAGGNLTQSGQTFGATGATLASSNGATTVNGAVSSNGTVALRGTTVTTGAQAMAAGNVVQVQAQTLNNAGAIQAQNGLALSTTTINNSGRLYDGGASTTIATQTLTNSGSLVTHGALNVNATTLNSSGELGSETGDVHLTTAGNLAITGKTVATQGALTANANGDLTQAGQAFAATGTTLASATGTTTVNGEVSSNASVSLRGATVATGSQAVVSGATVQAQAQTLNNAGLIQASNGLGLAAATINNSGRLYDGGAATTIATQTLTNTGSLIAHGGLNVNATTLDSSGTLGSETGDVHISTTGNLSVTGKTVATQGALTANAGGNLTQGGQTYAATGAQLTSAGLTSINGQLGSGGSIAVTAQDLAVANAAALSAQQNLAIQTQASVRNAGVLYAGQAIDSSSATFDNTGSITGTNATRIHAATTAGNSGNLYGGTTTVTAQTLTNTGSLTAHGALNVTATTLNSSGELGSEAGDVSLATTGDLSITGKTVAAQGKLTANAGGNLTQAGQTFAATGVTLASSGTTTINGTVSSNATVALGGGTVTTSTQGAVAGNAVQIQATTLDNAGSIQAQNGLALTTTAINNSGRLHNGAASTTINTQSLVNTGSLTTHGALNVSTATLNSSGELGSETGDVNLAATGDLSITGKTVTPGALVANAGANLTQAGQTYAATGAQLSAGALTTVNGQLGSDGAIAINTHDLNVANAATLSTSQTLTLQAQAGITNAGTTYAAQNLNSASATLDNSGSMYGATGTRITTTAAATNSGSLVGGNGLTLQTGSLNSTGILGAEQGDLTLTSTGDLAITGKTVATNGALNAQAGGNLTQGGSTYAATSATLKATGNASTAGSLQSAGAIQLQAGGALNNAAGVVSNAAIALNAGKALTNTGSLQGTTLTAQGATLSNSGRMLASGDVTLTGTQSLTNTSSGVIAAGVLANGNLGATGTATLNSSGQLTNAGAVYGGQAVVLSGGGIALTGGTVGSRDLQLTSTGDIDNSNTTLAASNLLSMQAQGTLHNAGGTLSGSQVALGANALDNTNGTIVQTGTTPFALNLAGILNNSGGRIAANASTMQVSAGALVNTNGRIEHAGTGGLTVASGSALDNQGGQLVANGAIGVSAAQALNNVGGNIGGVGTTTVNAGSLDTSNSGVIAGSGTVNVTASGLLANHGGLIAQRGAGALTVDANAIDNSAQGILGAEGSATITSTADANNSGGTLYAGNGLTVQAGGALKNASGTVQSKTTLALNASQAIDNTNGQIASAGDTQVIAASLTNANGRLVNDSATATRVTVTGGIDNRGGTLGSTGGDIALNAASLDNSVTTGASRIVSGHDLMIANAGQINNAGGLIFATNNLTQSGSTTFSNAGGQIGANGTVQLAGSAFDNTGGTIVANQIALTQSQLNNTNGTLSANVLGANLGQLNGTGGRLFGNQEADIHLAGDYTHNGQQTFDSNGLLNLTVDGTLTNNATLQTPGALQITTGNLVNTATGTLHSQNADGTSLTRVDATNISNAGRIDGDTVALVAGNVSNTGTVIGNTVQVQADTLTNGRDLGTTIQATPYNEGFIGATKLVDLRVGQTLSNLDAAIYSLGDLSVAGRTAGSNAANVLNSSGQISAENDVAIAADTITNQRRVVNTSTGAYTGPADVTSPRVFVPVVDATTYNALNAWYTNYEINVRGQQSANLTRAPSAWQWTVTNYQTQTQLDSASAEGQIKAGRDALFTVGNSLTNNVSTIAAGRNVLVDGAAYGSTPGANVQNIALASQLTGSQQAMAFVDPTQQSDPSTYATFRTHGGLTSSGKRYYESPYIPDSANGLAIGSPTTVTDVGPTLLSSAITAGSAIAIDAHNVTNGSVVATSGAASVAPGAGWQGITGAAPTLGNASNVGAATANVSSATVGSLATVVSLNVAGTTATTTASTVSTGSGGVPGGGTISGGAQAPGGSGATLGSITTSPQAPGGLNAGSGSVAAPQVVAPGSNVLNTPPSQVLGSVNNPLGSITPPTGHLFTLQPGGRYLIVTDPRFANYGQWLGSDYMMGKLGLKPDDMLRRLGDDYYEQWLVTEQITGLTGRKYLAASNGLDQYRDLMDAGVRASSRFSLSLGIALTPAQIAALDEDIVWMVEKIVDGQKVLVPVVYLSQADALKYHLDGATIAANDVSIRASGTVTNAGTIRASDALSIQAGDLVNSGTLKSGGVLYASAVNDIVNRNGNIQGGQVALVAGRDVVSGSSINLGATGGAHISADQGLSVQAGRDIQLSGTQVTAGGNAALVAGRNLTLSSSNYQGLPANAAAPTLGTHVQVGGDALLKAGQDITLDRSTVNAGGNAVLDAGHDINIRSGAGAITGVSLPGSAPVPGVPLRGNVTTIAGATLQTLETAGVTAGNHVVLNAGHDVNLAGANLDAGKMLAVAAGHDLNSTAVTTTNTSTVMTTAKRASGTLTNVDQTVHGSQLSGGAGVALSAGNDATLQAANVNSAAGAVTIDAGRDVSLTTATENHTLDSTTEQSKRNWIGTKTVNTTHDRVNDALAVGTQVSGDSVAIQAGRDATVQGSQVVATHDVAIAAGNNLTITSADNVRTEGHRDEKTVTGVMTSGGLSVMKGVRQTTTQMRATETSAEASTIGSLDGKVSLTAGNDLKVHGSDVLSATGTDITGKTVTIESAEEVRQQQNTIRFREDGAKLAITGSYANTANGIIQAYQGASHTDNDRLKALYAAQAVYGAYQGAKGSDIFGKQQLSDAASQQAQSANAQNGNGAQKGGSWGITVTGSHQQSDTRIDTAVVQQRASNIASGGDVNIKATEGDLMVSGSHVNGQNVTLDAAKNLVLQSSQSGLVDREKTDAWGAEAGVALTFSGNGASLGFYGAANGSQDRTAHTATTHDISTVTADKTLTLKSGQDTTLQGAQAKGETVKADVGGNLNLVSEQAKDAYRNTNWGIAGSITAGYGFDYSLSASAGQIKSDYKSVQDKTGIAAGMGGFDIHVGGNTKLVGADIASTADASKNHLSTNSLTAENLKNEAKYSAVQVSISVSGGGGQSGSGGGGSGGSDGMQGYTRQSTGTSVSPGFSVPQNKDKKSVTTSGIAAGAIEVRNGDTSALATLDRNVTSLDNSAALKPIFDLQKVKDNQQAGQIAGQLSMSIVGDIATHYQKQAALEAAQAQADYKQAEANGDQAGMADALARQIAATQQLQSWTDGGAKKIALHAIAGGLTAAAGGGNVGGGALGAGVAEASRPLTLDQSKSIQQWASLLAGSVGGGSGAATALKGEQFNRQLHPEEFDWIFAHADEFAKEQGITREQAINRLVLEGAARVDKTINEALGSENVDKDALAFLGKAPMSSYGPDRLFTERDDTKYADFHLNGDYLANNDRNLPTLSQALASRGAWTRDLQQTYEPELLGYANHGSSDVANGLVSFFGGEPGMAWGIGSDIYNGKYKEAGVAGAFYILTRGLGKAAGPLIEKVASKLPSLTGSVDDMARLSRETVTSEQMANEIARTANRFATGTDEAIFWSGVGREGDKIAADWAAKNGGATLESTLESRGITLPTWDSSNPAVVAAWRDASAQFARGASGNVRVLQADSVRVDSVWAEIEFPALKANPNVKSITMIDPRTGASTVIWRR